MSSTHPIFAHSTEKFDLSNIIRNSYKTMFENFSYLTLFFKDKEKIVLKNTNEVEKILEKIKSKKISSFSLSNDFFSFDFILLLDSNLEISFYIDFSQQSNKGKILKYIFDLLNLNKSELVYLSNFDDDFDDHYEVQEDIENLLVKKDYSKVLEYIKNRKHYFCLVSFKNTNLNTEFIKDDFKINKSNVLFLQNQKDKFI